MKQSEAAQFWPLIKAWSEGKTLQFNHGGGAWIELDFYDFSYDASRYRIKPEPREFYIAMSEYGPCGVSEVNHGPVSFGGNAISIVRVREVIQ